MTYNKTYSKLEYKKFRVKSTIKSFRDLEVYKKTTHLAAEIFIIPSFNCYFKIYKPFNSFKWPSISKDKLSSSSWQVKKAFLSVSASLRHSAILSNKPFFDSKY